MSDDTIKECRVEEYKVSDILDYGQGYDDTILELLKAFNQFKDGYYSLINYGDEWWKNFNQSTMFDDMMSEAWNKLEGKNFNLMENITKMSIAITGAYVKFDKFVEGVERAYAVSDRCCKHEKQKEEG